MTTQETLSVVVGLLNLAVVVAIFVHLRGQGLRPPLPLVAVALFFLVRAIARLVPPLGEEPEWLALALDGALLLVLVLVLASARRLVTSFVHERDALERAQIDYDDALLRHESNVAEAQGDVLERLEATIARLAAADSDDERASAERAARETLEQLRAR